MCKTDVVVIGGGIIGASCAYYLARSGVQVTLIEKASLCSEASNACQGHLYLWELPAVNVQLAKRSKILYQQLAGELDLDLELRPTGSLAIADDEEGLAKLAHTLAEVHAAGAAGELLDREEVLRREPHISPKIAGGAFFPDDAQVNPLLATLALADGARKLGARVCINTDVTGLRIGNDRRIQAVETSNGTVHTDCVVNAAGAWSGGIAGMAGIQLPVVPRKGNLMVVGQVPDAFMNCKIIIASGYLDSLTSGSRVAVAANIQQTKEGNLILGSSREFAGFDKQVDPEVISEIAKRCIRYFPCLAGMHAIRSWAGLRPHSPDLIPIISDTAVKGFLVAGGHEGAGITMGPITGLLISQMVLGTKTELPIEALSIHRFDQPPTWGGETVL